VEITPIGCRHAAAVDQLTNLLAKVTVDLAKAFEAQAVRVGSAVHRTGRAEAGALAARVLRDATCRTVALAEGLPGRPALAEALRAAAFSLVAPGELWPTQRADGGISVAVLGVAETGSVLLAASAEDRRVELCTDVHLVLLDAATLVPTLDAALAPVREISARPPAYATLVSGPSRSADIERQLTIGVHGPRALHILLVVGE
jgi:L-lactate dehydrogenase complex protein LldG